MASSEETWDPQRLKNLQSSLNLGLEGLAGVLGLTPRTLSDFMKPKDQGGRPPSDPVMRLIDLLTEAAGRTNPLVNLVLIHGEWSSHEHVDTVVNMHSANGANNEFHYIAHAPGASLQQWVIDGLLGRRIQPHFLVCDKGFGTQEALDCYFSATAMWEAARAKQRGLAHITIAAEMKRFWPLARELQNNMETQVTLVRHPTQPEDRSFEEFLEKEGLGCTDAEGRRFGFVDTLIAQGGSANLVSYGFIQPAQKQGDGEWIRSDEPAVFFSYNHMRKDPLSGRYELEIGQLVENDIVSYGIGVNNRGKCAIDVALVDRLSSVVSPKIGARGGRPNRRIHSDGAELEKVLTDAVAVCANKRGWALMSHVGNRIRVLHPEAFEKKKQMGITIKGLAEQFPDTFELNSGGTSTETDQPAACIRVRGTA